MTLGQAVDVIKGTITSFEADRNDFDDIWKEIKIIIFLWNPRVFQKEGGSNPKE